MSKDLWKPVEKPTGNPRDLVSVIIFFIVIIAIIIVLSFVLHEDKVFGPPSDSVYNTDKDYIQNAVADYASRNEGILPILNCTYTVTGCSNCSVINISALLPVNGGRILSEVPESCHLSASGNDNCGGNASLGCINGSSYIWIVDAIGDVFSYCAGTGCTTNNSGFQDAWP